jgi:hypothetical protein
MENNDSKIIISFKEKTYGNKKKAKKDALSKHFNLKVKELEKNFGIKLTKKDIAPN